VLLAAHNTQLATNDTEATMQLLEEVACADLARGSIYERTEANLLKVP
jgi:hypothetical protein